MNLKTVSKQVAVLILLVSSHFVSAASVGTGGVSTAFSKGATSIGIVAGSGSAFRDDYLVLGVGVGYYVANGLELGIDMQHWFLGGPAISKISPQIRYVFTRSETIKPYIGAFYRRTFIDDMDDVNSHGYRAGAYFTSKHGVYVGAGIVHEQYQDCSQFIDCSTTSPEILISFSF